MKNLHDLKAEITKSNISLSVIIKKFSEIYNQNLSKTALSLYLNQGIEPKKIDNLYEKLEQVLKKIKSSGGRTMINSVYLSLDAKQHFKLKSDPFAPYPTKLSDIIMLQSHYYADEIMKTSAQAGLFAVITGEVGSGKTTVRDKFLEENKQGSRFIAIIPETERNRPDAGSSMRVPCPDSPRSGRAQPPRGKPGRRIARSVGSAPFFRAALFNKPRKHRLPGDGKHIFGSCAAAAPRTGHCRMTLRRKPTYFYTSKTSVMEASAAGLCISTFLRHYRAQTVIRIRQRRLYAGFCRSFHARPHS